MFAASQNAFFEDNPLFRGQLNENLQSDWLRIDRFALDGFRFELATGPRFRYRSDDRLLVSLIHLVFRRHVHLEHHAHGNRP